MRVKLSLLDRQGTLHYTDTVPVCIYEDSYKTIGTCSIYKDANGCHFGVLELDQPVNEDLFFYYRNMSNNAGIFIFSGLDFMPNQIKESPTTQLRDMIFS